MNQHAYEPTSGSYFKAYKKATQSVCRGFKESIDSYFIFAPRCRKRGRRYDKTTFDQMYIILPEKDKTKEWHQNLTKALNKLYKTGLWTELVDIFENLLKLSWDEYQTIKHAYYYELNTNKTYKKYHDLYPFLFDEKRQLKYAYFDEIANCRIKTMYFGTWENKNVKQHIKMAISNKAPYRTTTRAQYDVSFQYDPMKNKAWYAEEYRNCGNGHYYIALDEHTAIFYEDD